MSAPATPTLEAGVARYVAFTARGRGGNPAAVTAAPDGASTEELQAIAARIGAPATAFVLESDRADVRLRFFTPAVEENVCGHATVAAITHLAATGRAGANPITVETNAGVLRARFDAGVAWLEYGEARAWEVSACCDDVAPALGLDAHDLHDDLPVLAATAGRAKLFVPVPTTLALDAITADLERVAALCRATGTTGVVAFTVPGRDGCFTDARHFAPLAGIPEDVATGNAHAALAAVLAASGLLDDGERRFAGAQGYALGRPSRIEVRASVVKGRVERVEVGGRAEEVRS